MPRWGAQSFIHGKLAPQWDQYGDGVVWFCRTNQTRKALQTRRSCVKRHRLCGFRNLGLTNVPYDGHQCLLDSQQLVGWWGHGLESGLRYKRMKWLGVACIQTVSTLSALMS